MDDCFRGWWRKSVRFFHAKGSRWVVYWSGDGGVGCAFVVVTGSELGSVRYFRAVDMPRVLVGWCTGAMKVAWAALLLWLLVRRLSWQTGALGSTNESVFWARDMSWTFALGGRGL